MNYGVATVPVLIEDAKRALKANAQFSSLCITLSLVNKCASIEWEKHHKEKLQNKQYKKSYKEWYDMWFSSERWEDDIKASMKEYEKNYKKNRKSNSGVFPDLNGELLYEIRCHILHDMSVSKKMFENLGDNANKNIKEFLFILSEPNEFGFGASCYFTNKEKQNSMYLDIQDTITLLLHLVNLYYEQNKELFIKTIPIYDFTNTYIKEEQK